jgi:hypothetical protein
MTNCHSVDESRRLPAEGGCERAVLRARISAKRGRALVGVDSR